MPASLAKLPAWLKGTLIDDIVILPYTHDEDPADMYRKIKDPVSRSLSINEPISTLAPL